MDKQLIEEKPESLQHSVSRVSDKYLANKDLLLTDFDAQDVITLNLIRAVHLSVDIAAHIISESPLTPPSTMAESFARLKELGIISSDLELKMVKAVGFRNVAIHNYEEIDWNIVTSICEFHLDDFRQFAKAIDSLL